MMIECWFFQQHARGKQHIFEVEAAHGLSGRVLYVIYPSDGEKLPWRIQAVSGSDFKSRRPLPESWRGLRDEDIAAATGIQGTVFVHSAGFIGGNATLQGALQMAEAALNL